MSADYQIEALLRPPVEFYTSVVCVAFAGLLLVLPEFVLLTPIVAYYSSGLLIIFALHRAYQGYRIVRYQRGLKKLPFYSMSADQVPVSHRKLFLGKGFRWSRKHTQRLWDIYDEDVDDYLTPSRTYRFARWLELKFEYTPILKHLPLIFSLGTPRNTAISEVRNGVLKGVLYSFNVFFLAFSFLNPVRPLPPVGGAPEIHAVGMWEGERDIFSDIGERVGHTLVLGTTRVGKTRLAELFITQDIRRGDVTIVFDPKGDADLMKKTFNEAKAAGRPVYIFHLGYPDISARYNPVGEFSRITEVASRIADQLPSEGNSAAFKMFGWRFVNIIAQALVKLGEQPNYPTISRYLLSIDTLFVRYAQHYLNEKEIDGWTASVQTIQDNLTPQNTPLNFKGRDVGAIALIQYLEKNDIYEPVLFGLMGAFRYDKNYFDKIVSSLAPLLEQLTSGRTAELLSPDYMDVDDKRPIFDWKTVIQQKAVVYIGLDALSDPVVGSAIGASMFADLTSIAGYIYKFGLDHGQATLKNPRTGKAIKTKLPKIALHADEFNEIVGDQFIPMLNKAGGAQFQVTAYTQTADDILAGIGDKAKAGQIEGNFNTIIMLRVRTVETAEILTSFLPDVRVTSLTAVTSARDNSDLGSDTHFTTTNEDRITKEKTPLVTPDYLTSLPKGQCFALIEGGQLYKLRLPLPANDDTLSGDINTIAKDMKLKYGSGGTSEDWFSANDKGWYKEVV